MRTMKQTKPRRRAESLLPAPRVEFDGICTVCRKAAECTFPRDPRTAVTCCEEFDGYMPLGVRAIDNPKLTKPQSGSGGRAETAPESQGLCRNCDNRQACTFPKPEGGVWHCEEYV